MITSTAPPTGAVAKYTAPTDGGKPVKDVTPSKNGASLKETDFLHLLTTQLEHQDPLNPEKDTDFAAQMAQYSSLAETRKLNDTIGKQTLFTKVSSAASLIGKNVTTSDVDATGKPKTGTVSGINVTPDGTILLKVGDSSVPIEHVTAIAPQTPQLSGKGLAPANGPTSQTLGLAVPPSTSVATPVAAEPTSPPTATDSISPALQSAVQRVAQQAALQASGAASASPALPVNAPSIPTVPAAPAAMTQ